MKRIQNQPTDQEEAVDWIECWLGWKLHNYQKDFVKACSLKKRVVSLWPRQSGKTTTIAAFVIYKALTSIKFHILITSRSLQQSRELFLKTRNFVNSNPVIQKFIESSTQTEIIFQNGSRIRCLPTGPFGDTILGFTADIVIIDESGVVKDEIVNRVIVPMVAATNGQIIKSGTPRGKNHFYESCYGEKSNYKLCNISWREAVKAGQYRQEFIDEQMETLSELEFGCEFEAKFMENESAYFTQDLIDSCIEEFKLIENVY